MPTKIFKSVELFKIFQNFSAQFEIFGHAGTAIYCKRVYQITKITLKIAYQECKNDQHCQTCFDETSFWAAIYIIGQSAY